MPLQTASALEEALTSLLAIESKNMYSNIPKNCNISVYTNTAVRHQNILGWDNFLRGYISKYWGNIGASQGERGKSWESKLTSSILRLHKEIWDGCNTFVHGKTIDEARHKAREAVLDRVKEIYKKTPSLASRYPSILEVSLQNRLKRTTDQLKDWLKRI
jgi:hypothetical protein